MKTTFRLTLFLTALTLAAVTSGCMPEHLNTFDGQAATATFSPTSNLVFQLRDTQGHGFFLRSRSVAVKFQINAVSASWMTVTDASGQSAQFRLPKSLLNQNGQLISLPGESTGQPIDLTAVESSRVLRKWKQYRHEESPIYTTTINPDGTSSQTLVGYSDDYYEDTQGMVERSLLVNAYYKGAAARKYPAELKLGILRMIVRTSEERLSSRSISYSEYKARR